MQNTWSVHCSWKYKNPTFEHQTFKTFGKRLESTCCTWLTYGAIKDSQSGVCQVDPKIYQKGNYQSIHHSVKLGHSSIIDESKLDWPTAVDFPTSSSQVCHFELVGSYILLRPSKGHRGCEAVISAVIGRLTQRQQWQRQALPVVLVLYKLRKAGHACHFVGASNNAANSQPQ